MLTLFVLSLSRRKPLLAGFILGIGLTLTPFNFVLVPFFLLYLWRVFKSGKAALSLVTIAVGVLLFVGPFLVWSASDFTGSRRTGLDRKALVLFTPSVNLAYAVYHLVPMQFAKIVQAIAVWAVSVLCLAKDEKSGRLPGLDDAGLAAVYRPEYLH